jgi:hypothetical protein
MDVVLLSLALTIPVTLVVNLITPTVRNLLGRMSDRWTGRNTRRAEEQRKRAQDFADSDSVFTQYLITRTMSLVGVTGLAVVAGSGATTYVSNLGSPIGFSVFWTVAFMVTMVIDLQILTGSLALHRKVRELQALAKVAEEEPTDDLPWLKG